jgi:3-hydroxybutyrate dehydrogenase
MTVDLHGTFAVITGAAQGLGYAIAKAYTREGLRLAIMDFQAEKLASVEAELRASGGDCTGIPVDLTDAEQTDAAIRRAMELYGTPRVLVHNAAVLIERPLLEIPLVTWQKEINIALQAAYQLTYAVWQPMTDAGGGSIVYVSSRAGIEGFPNGSSYCAAKHGLEGLMKSLSGEGKPRNIAVNTITPGMYMHTPMSERNYPEELKQQWVDPIRLTPAFVFLARQDASGVTGQRLNAWELSQEDV